MTNSPIEILDENELSRYLKNYNSGLSEATAHVPIHAIDGPVASTSLPISFASTDEQEIIAAPGVSLRIRIVFLKLFCLSGSNFVVTMKSGADEIGYCGGQADVANYIHPLCLGANEAFNLQSDIADQIYGQVCYWTETIDNL